MIEYDGEIHYFGWLNNLEDLKDIQMRDKYKNEWCQKNGIKLIRIPYTHLENICLNDLLPETSKFLVTVEDIE